MLTGEVTVALFAGKQITIVRFTVPPAQVPPVGALNWMFSVVVAPWVTLVVAVVVVIPVADAVTL
jgi:hypothetical protein